VPINGVLAGPPSIGSTVAVPGDALAGWRKRPACQMLADVRRALERLGLLREVQSEDLDAVWLYGPQTHGEHAQDETELRLLLVRDSPAATA